MQNGYIEGFDGRLRDECLNEHWFQTLHQARKEIAAWRLDYNEVRPHGSIGRMPPVRFAGQHRRHASDAARQLTPTNDETQQSSIRTPAETLVRQKGAGHGGPHFWTRPSMRLASSLKASRVATMARQACPWVVLGW